MNLKEKLLKLLNDLKDKFEDLKHENKREFLKRNIIVVSILAIVAIFAIGFAVGNSITTKESVLKQLQRDLEKGNTRNLDDFIVINGEDIERDKLKPLSDYYKGKGALVNNLVDDVKNDKSNIMKLVSEKTLFGQNYKIELSTFCVEVKKNNKDEEVYLNDQKIEGDTEIKGLIPGEYKVRGILKSSYGDIAKEESIVLMKNEKVDLDIQSNYVTVNSEFKDADVYINGEKTGKTVSEFKKIGPFPTDGSVKLQIERNFPWGLIKSEEVQVYNKPDIKINLDMKNETLFDSVETCVKSFYESVFKALNEENKDVIDAATEEVKEKVFGILQQKYFFLKNKYEITSINIDKEKSSFTYKDGEYKGSVVCDVNYDVSKILFDLGKESKTTKFFTKIVYKGDKWVVSDVENFSLEK